MTRRSPSSPTSQDLVEHALAASGAVDCIVIASDSTAANLRWADNTLTTNGVARSRTITVISLVGPAAGVVTRQGVDSVDLVADVVAAADSAARQSSPAEDAGPLVGADASVGEWGEPAAEASISVFDAFAPDLGASFERAAGSGQRLYGFASYDLTTTFLGTSTGLRSRHVQPTGHVEINAKSADLARSTWTGVPTKDFGDIDMAAIHDDLERRLGWAARRLDLPPGRYETVLPPTAVADLMISLYWAAEGRDAHEGRSVFSRQGGGTKVGERLASTPLTLRSDPGVAGIECGPFLTAARSGGDRSVFDNGAPLGPTSWISGGVLTSLVQTRFSAGLTGLPFTPYVDNLVLEASDAPGGAGGGAAGDRAGGEGGDSAGGAAGDSGGGLDGIIAGTERGLLLTCLWYIREVDPRTLLLTGLTRDGVYLIEGGEVTAAVNNFRFNESPVSVLARAAVVGSTERTLPREWSDYFTRTAMPAIRVEGFNMSSVSQAS
ncbi:MAG TPA: metallopeptidase TldD-related protein [Acidimicrobiales bacterium]|nr:metallopeptidase TldD-related protein [Acidimicrobiales bacterium]